MSEDQMQHLLTPAQKRARKKAKKQESMLKEMGVAPRKATKVKRKRKPMSPEQKAAAVERLAAARAKRSAGKEPNAHPRVLALEDDHPLSFSNSKDNLKMWREKVKSIRHQKDSKDSIQRREYQIAESYVKNLGIWIKDGVYLDSKYGSKRESAMEYVCLTPARHPDGSIKRTQGVYYPDLGEVWTQALAKEYT
jgi:hypothetical protein